METVCQGAGAGLWWPCKDHLSEKPDSMRLSVTIPNGLSDISNGRLISRQELSDHTTKWVWYISYPINSYNVAMNIGEFSHFSDTLIRNGKKLSMDYYCMPYNLDRAKLLFAESGSVVEMYEKDFGPYPFANDGLTLMESLYPMEHQSAVSVGSFNQPINSNKYDSQEIRRTMWHELAHEWWGNSISNSDYADLWIHEAFATYSEMLNWEREFGRERMMKELKKLKPENKEPLVGIYNVNHIHYDIGDMYSKGCLMLHTFRSCMDNDSLFFDLLRAIQRHFKYQTLATNQLVDFMCEYLHKDIRPFFNLYLKTTKIPVLLYRFSGQGKQLKVECKWLSDDPKFFMPVKLGSLQKGLKLTELGTDWKSISLPDIKEKQFIIDKENFYIGTRSE
jgi:aminopeptidase N